MARIWMPLPDRDFDVTEVAVPWKLAVEAGHEVVFATEAGATPAADPLLLTGVLFGKLGAYPEPKAFYAELTATPAGSARRRGPTSTSPASTALILPGGHAPGMKQYLGATALHAQIVEVLEARRPVGAICHGVLPLARSIDPDTGKPASSPAVRTTCLPKYMERSAYLLTFWKLGKLLPDLPGVRRGRGHGPR
jgi:putative intracellular protease/amidase